MAGDLRRLVRSGIPGVYRRGASWVVRWKEGGKSRKRFFVSEREACVFLEGRGRKAVRRQVRARAGAEEAYVSLRAAAKSVDLTVPVSFEGRRARQAVLAGLLAVEEELLVLKREGVG